MKVRWSNVRFYAALGILTLVWIAGAVFATYKGAEYVHNHFHAAHGITIEE